MIQHHSQKLLFMPKHKEQFFDFNIILNHLCQYTTSGQSLPVQPQVLL